MTRRAVGALAWLLLGSVSCDNPLSPDTPSVTRIEVNPTAVSVTVGDTRSITARVVDADGAVVTDRKTFWSTQDPTVATVSQVGLVTAIGAGSTQVAVSAGGKSAVIPVSVTPRPVSQVRVTPTTASVQAGATTSLGATPVDATGATVAGKTVAWATSSAAIATVTSTGTVTGIAPGTATITASVDGVNGSSVVTVTPVPVASVTVSPSTSSVVVGQGVQLSATTASSTGQTLSGRVITWSSSASGVATVSSTGLVTGIAAGTATITATSEGRTGSATITVTQVPVASIRVTPGTATVAAGRTVQLAAQALDANDNVLNRTITWSTDQPTVATVGSDGLVTAINTGAARITASVGTVSASATVTVTPVPVASLSIAPNGASLLVGGTQQLTATPRDAGGAALPGRVITWITGAPSVATVSQAGLVTAVGPGSAVIFAASEGVSSSVTITVSTIGVATVRVTPNTGSIQQGQSLQLAFTALDAGNIPLAGKVATWTSSNEAVATVSSTGRVVAITPGTVTITATVDGVPGTGSFTITQVPVNSVSVSPSSLVLSIGGPPQALVASLFDALGNPLSTSGRVILWSSSNPAVATVSASGVVQAVAAGNATITATCEGPSGSASVTVSPVAVASVTLAPPTASLNAGATQAVTATAKDAGGNVLTGRPVSWSSSDPTVATVNTLSSAASNTITAVAAGSATISAVIGGITGVATVSVTQVPIATITVTPNPGSVVEGSTLTLTATARDASNNVLTGRTIVWSSSNAQVSVSQAGVVTAVINSASQSATITASSPNGGSGGSTPSGTATVTVSFAPVAAVSLNPSTANISVGNTTTLAPSLTNSGGQTLSSTGRTLTWSSTTPAVATVSATGVVTALTPGTTKVIVTASSPGQAGTLPADTTDVTVTNVPVASVVVTPKAGPNPGTVHLGGPYARKFIAVPRDAGGNALTNRSIVWSVSDPTKALITQDGDSTTVTGQATTSSPITLTATSEGIPGTIQVTVDLVAVSSVSVSPSSATLNLFSAPTQALTASPLDSASATISGAALGGRTTSWTSTNPAAATVSAAGLVTAVAAGSTTVDATIGGTTGGAAITVQAPVTSVVPAVSPADSLILPGTLSGLVTIRDAGANALSGRLVTASSSNASVASVAPASATSNGSGQASFTITGVAKGTITLTTASEGVSAQVTNIRILSPVNSVTIAAPTDSVIGTATATVQATATLLDATGANISGQRPITWSSTQVGVATVGGSGLITVVGLGTTSITATSEGKTATLTFRVLPSVNSITVATPGDSILGTGTLQATADLRDASNGVITGRPITWSSSSSGVATVNASTGLITGLTPGSTNITGLVEGKTHSVTVRVLAPIASMALTPATDSLIGSGTLPLTVTATASGAVPLQGRALTLASSNTAAATISPATATTNASGQVAITATYVAPGNTTLTVSAPAEGQSVTRVLRMLAPVASVIVTSPGDSIIGTGTLPLTATTKDASNNTLTGRPVTWSGGNPAVATISAAGLVTGVAAGTTSFTATAEGQSSTAHAVRVLAPVATVAITAPDSSVFATQTQQATVVARDGANTVLTGRPIVYASSNPAKATISAAGLITAVDSGSTTISATVEGVSASFTFTVSLVPVASMSIAYSPAAPDSTGRQKTFAATLRDTANNVITGRTVTWSSSDNSKLQISSGGIATLIDSGSVTVTGTSGPAVGGGTISATATLTIVNTPVGNILLSSTNVTVGVGASSNVTANVLDIHNGNAASRACTVTSSNPAAATASPAAPTTSTLGAFVISISGVASGSSTVTVTCETVNRTITVTVP